MLPFEDLPAVLSAILFAALFVLFALHFIPAALFSLQIALARPDASPPAVPTRRGRLAVLIPAHDEAAGIAATLHALLPQLAADDRIVVVADNCTDDTGRVAAELGAETLERSDDALRGKGYALDFGMRHLASDPPAVVIVIDADCIAGPQTLDILARRCLDSGRPVQALYLMQKGKATGVRGTIGEFAWTVKNLARPLGYRRLGLPCQLMGSGMAFPWNTISQAGLASGELVEDLKLGLDLARAGTAPLFCPEALVTSAFPANAAGAASQRTRWEHGHLGIICREVPCLLWEALRRRDLFLATMALDICVPPLTLLAFALTGFALAGGALATLIAGGWSWLHAFALLPAATFGSAVILAWWRFGRSQLPLAALAAVPAFMLRKIPVYLAFLFRRQKEWVRSQRDQ